MGDDATLGARIAEARKAAGLTQTEVAGRLGVAHSRVSEWERGTRRPNSGSISRLAAVLGVTVDQLLARGASAQLPQMRVPRGTHADSGDEWPDGWRSRAYRLQLEAADAGATEDEIAAVRNWMLDPRLQAMWAGGKPNAEQAKNLEGIEIGARAWLRARGRAVRAKA
jgi:transcriptional regulator with XRE-family HTH domain